MDSKLMFCSGIITLIVMIIIKYWNLYFINKILPKRSQNEQNKYYEIERNLSEKGAFNVPFKDGKLISKENSRNDFYNFGIVISLILIIISFM